MITGIVSHTDIKKHAFSTHHVLREGRRGGLGALNVSQIALKQFNVQTLTQACLEQRLSLTRVTVENRITMRDSDGQESCWKCNVM